MATDHAHRPVSRWVEGRLHDDVLLERYHYPPGPAVTLPRHAHDEYHVCLNLGTPGSYHYRGARYVIPPGSLSVIMPDEVHLARDLDDRDRASSYTMLYVDSARMRRVAAEHGGPRAGLPYFSDPLIRDDDLVRRFARLPTQLGEPALAQDTHLLGVLTALVTRYGGVRTAPPPEDGPRRAVDVVRAYLHDNYAADVSLTDLARLVGLSPYHLTRLFRRHVGMPPHAYQVHVRIDRAKRLLLRGLPVTTVAHEAGFFDLSHLTRHFKRHVGVPPGRYAAAAAACKRARTYITAPEAGS